MLISFVYILGKNKIVYADDTVADSAEDFIYSINEDGIYITGLAEGEYTKINIPEEIEGKTVVKIGNNAFSDCSGITEVFVPDTVQSIGVAAFKGTNLTSITIPFVGARRTSSSPEYEVFGYIFGYETNTRKSQISENATIQYIKTVKYNGSNTDYYYGYYIPKTLKSIKITDASQIFENTFYNCKFVENIELNDGIESIGAYSFYLCNSLKSIVIPDSVTEIGKNAFIYCSSLTDAYVSKNLSVIPKGFMRECKSLESIEMPVSYSSIGEYAFEKCVKLQYCTFSKNLKIIESYAFNECESLKELDFDSCDNLTRIGMYAFNGCKNITKLNIPSSVTLIDYAAFKGTSLTEISLPFVGCEDADPERNKHNYVFGSIFGYEIKYGYYSTSNMHNTSELTAQYCFDRGSNYSSDRYATYRYYIPQTLRKVTITNATQIPSNAFYNCRYLEEISINNGVTSIGKSAFHTCRKLSKFIIPESIETIGDTAFEDCDILAIYASKDSIGYSYANTNNIPVHSTKSVVISEEKIVLNRNESKQLDVEVTMLNDNIDDNASVSFSTSDRNVVTVINGVVKANGPGKATITASYDGCSDTCEVEVYYILESISLANNSTTIDINKNRKMEVSFFPSNTTDDKTITWSTSNNNIISVDSDGTIKGLKKGKATITANSVMGFEDSIEIEVLVPITYISISKSSTTMEKGASQTLSMSYSPSDTTDSYSWSSSNSNIVSVNQTGYITAKNSGTAIISVNTSRGLSATCTVNVIISSIKVEFEKSSMNVFIEDNVELTPILTPSNTTDSLTWTSSNNNVIKITSDNKLQLLSSGFSKITVKTTSGKSAYCNIIVANDLSKASLVLTNTTYKYTGNEIIPDFTIKHGEQELLSSGYNVEYLNNSAVGKATIRITGTGRYSGSIEAYYYIEENRINEDNIMIDLADAPYTGLAITKDISVTYGDKVLSKDLDYKVSYSNNIAVGTASVSIEGVGIYCGKVDYNFKIYEKYGHNSVLKNKKEATYEEEGYSGDQVCEICGEVLEKGYVIRKKENATGRYKLLKDHILNQTSVDSYGNKFIAYYDNKTIKGKLEQYIYEISYSVEEASFHFVFYNRDSDSTSKLEMIIGENGSEKAIVRGTYLLVESIAEINVKDFNANSDIYFDSVGILNTNDNRIQNYFNSSLKLGFYGWDILLLRDFGLDINMGDLGFVSFETPGNHTWNEGVITEEPTNNKEGVKIYTCDVCGETRRESIPALINKNDNSKKEIEKKENQAMEKSNSATNHSGGDKSYCNEWVNGKWYDVNGIQTYQGTLSWKCNSTGWWVEDSAGWYPQNQWQKIDGIWYFFKPDGYMASNEYYNGYWFNMDGSWDDKYLLSWKSNSTGWWVEDKSGWWPSNSWLKIDGYWYYFDASGYMVTSQYVDGYWIGNDGVCQ